MEINPSLKQRLNGSNGQPSKLDHRSCSRYVLSRFFVFCKRGDRVRASFERENSLGLFFSVFPDPSTAVRLAQLARRLRAAHDLKGQPLLTPRFHCSLYGFDDRDSSRLDVVAKATAAGAIVAALPFRVSFDCVKSFAGGPDRHPLVLVGEDGIVGPTRLHASLCIALRKVGFRPRGLSSFTPHVTLLYDRRCIDEQPIQPVAWTVEEIVLVLCFTGRTKYLQLRRWRLAQASRQSRI